MVGFWAIVMRPARNQQKKVQQLQQGLQVGERGDALRGDLRHRPRVDERRVELEVAPGTVLTVARQVVVRRVESCDTEPASRRPPRGHRPGRRAREPEGRGLRRHEHRGEDNAPSGRTLLIFGLTIAVALRPRRRSAGPGSRASGLDLEGGTRITLSAIAEGGEVTETKLSRRPRSSTPRVNGSGVSEAEVTTQGDRNIIVEIPGENRTDLVDAVKRTAQLRFRLVAGQPQPGQPAAERVRRRPAGRRPAQALTGKRRSRRRPRRSAPARPPRPIRDRRRSPTPTADAHADSGRSPTAPRPTQEQPQVTEKGASVDDPLAWSTGPRRRVAAEVRRVHLPAAGRGRSPDRRRPRRAAGRLRRPGG